MFFVLIFLFFAFLTKSALCILSMFALAFPSPAAHKKALPGSAFRQGCKRMRGLRFPA